MSVDNNRKQKRLVLGYRQQRVGERLCVHAGCAKGMSSLWVVTGSKMTADHRSRESRPLTTLFNVETASPTDAGKTFAL
jgi:hypothetical protein